MVDINLFKDEEEEKWESDSGREEKSESGDDLIDEFSMDEELTQSSALSDKDLLDSDEPIPDFDEPGENVVEEDYQFGNIKERKTSPWIWVALGVVLVFAAIYFFYIQPRQTQPEQIVPRMPSGVSEGDLSTEQTTDSGEGLVDSDSGERGAVSEEGTALRETGAESQISGLSALATVGTVVDASVAVFNNLTQAGQLGTIVLEGYRFHVGYVSETPGVAQAMGERIKAILGSSGYEVSPEDPHRTAGKMHYWGVISGVIPQKASTSPPSVESRRFTSMDQFIQEINTLVQNNRLSVQETQKFSTRSEEGLSQTPVRMKIEGSKAQTLVFLNALKGFQGNYRLLKLTMAPVDISDFQANQVRLVLEFALFFV
ncbi:hypothetical protein JW824_09465 [bacterium]|nr:hypothetical protein [bacterium]RQV94318.1 MAG: hypothetical protein EH221_07665 [bacterium]